jgi:anthranilate synthase/aminodeoxychorismate synthase-like glutamine amidotransferase
LETNSLQPSLVIYILDNYDSFTYNLEHYVRMCGARTIIAMNDRATAAEIREVAPAGLILSPGPGRPEDSGRLLDLIEAFAGELPMLGVCLGHQALATHFGAELTSVREIVHGKSSPIEHDGKGVFAGLPSPMNVGRYHSLAVPAASLPACLEISAITADGEVMAFRHREFPIEAVQFHPESILTDHGTSLIANFLHAAAVNATDTRA